MTTLPHNMYVFSFEYNRKAQTKKYYKKRRSPEDIQNDLEKTSN